MSYMLDAVQAALMKIHDQDCIMEAGPLSNWSQYDVSAVANRIVAMMIYDVEENDYR